MRLVVSGYRDRTVWIYRPNCVRGTAARMGRLLDSEFPWTSAEVLLRQLCAVSRHSWRARCLEMCPVARNLSQACSLSKNRVIVAVWLLNRWVKCSVSSSSVCCTETFLNPLKPNDDYSGPTAPLTSKRCILYIYSTNIGTEYFKHGIYSPFFPLQNAVCFINLTYLVLVLFTFYIQVC